MLYLAFRNSILLLVISYFLIGCSANYTNKEDFFNSKSSSNQKLFFYDKEQSKKDFENQCKSTPLKVGSNPYEISQAVKFIIQMPSFTGQMITLDGGEHLIWIKPENKNFRD